VTDWADTELGDLGARRVGLVHAASNAVALSLYTASLVARRKGSRGRGVALGAAGAGVLSAGGYLGAHLSFVRGVGVDQTVFDPGPTDWTPAVAADAVPAGGEPTSVEVAGTPVLMVRQGGAVRAIHDRCSHRGCLLSTGEIEPGAVVCVCHGSRFSLEDGSILRGPATTPQPAFETREREGRLEIRLK
jgi:nitrite reductase/ring-hydroxylating ferredoxin subunit